MQRSLLAATSMFAAALGLALDSVSLDSSTGHFVDVHGRMRIFHGVNAVFKKAPWYPRPDRFSFNDSLDPETMSKLHEWGFNVVRLGVMWPGVEPQPGVVDRGYLAAISNISKGLAEHGVYTLVDLHQDIGSRRFCGEGFPEHYVEALLRDPGSLLSQAAPFPEPALKRSDLQWNASGFPELASCVKRQFTTYYLTEQVGALWRELYTSGTPLHEGFVRYWREVGSAFKGAPHVLAYELLNEPNIFCLESKSCSPLGNVLLGLGNSVEAEYLAPLYLVAAQAIRRVGAAQPILYEAAPAPKVTLPFPSPPLDTDTQQGLAYHIYCQPGDGDGLLPGLLCEAAQAFFEHTYFPFLERYPHVGSFMTEFGAVGGNAGELKHLDRLLAQADTRFQSWAYWQLKTYEDFTTANAAEALYDASGRLEVAKLKTLSRTYAPAIAGLPSHMSFDPSTAVFELVFNATVVQAPTVVYLNQELYYPQGYTLEVSPADCLQLSKPEQNWLHLTLPEDGACKGTMVQMRLTPRSAAEVVV